MHKHWHWEFSDKEIDQIVELASHYGSGKQTGLMNRWQALDMRKVSKKVFEWAKASNLIKLGRDMVDCFGKHRWYVKEGGLDRWYISDGHQFSYVHYLPPEAMWRMVSPILDRGKGYHTITSAKEWQNFGIWCSQDKEWDKIDEYKMLKEEVEIPYSQTRFIPFMIDILNMLSSWGYIWFQYAGTVWQVTIRKDS